MAPDSSRSAELRAQIEASKRQQNELERQADELRRQADELGRRAGQCGAEQRDLEGRLTLALAKEARTAAFWAGGGSLLVGDGVTDETLLHIASFLPTATDLLRLQLTSKRFGAKCIAAPSSVSGGGEAAAAPEMLSILEEAARMWVAGCSEQERGWVPRRGLESWLCLMHEVGVLRLPLTFGVRSGAYSITLSEDGAVATRGAGSGHRAAASRVVMRSGRHFVQLTVVAGYLCFGVIRPGWDVEGGVNAFAVDGHCFYSTYSGSRYPGRSNWEGMQTARTQGDRIGLLLDLDQGSMTVWKNDEQLGVMQAEGLTGPLCWAVLLNSGSRGDSARIESAPAPDE